ncbi:MAG: phosphatase PAP2 family protein [Verrucomicrobia bacterium]|nr:phosphatase PAP2 family protein [Verrucomicrobiota bacterium]
MTSEGRVQTRFLPGTIVCYVLLVVFYVVLVKTGWGHQLDDEAYLGRGSVSHQVIALDAVLLRLVSDGTIMAAAAGLFLISFVRRRALVGLITVAGFLIAVLGAEILKDYVFQWRALVPADAQLGEDLQGNSYPSGHATIVTAFVLSLLMVSPARWRPWLAAVLGAISSLFTTGVLFAGWHRASDALGALAWAGLCMNLAAAAAVRLRGQPALAKPRHGLLASIIVGVVILLFFLLTAAIAAPRYPHHDLPFLLLSGLIIAGSFALTAWYSRQFEAVDFRGARS